MSFKSKIREMFGGKKDENVVTTMEAIQKLRETENMLIKKQEYLEQKIEQEIETAKKNGSKNKRAAIQALKRKQRFVKQLQQIDGTLSSIEMQRESLEDANSNMVTISVMKKANDALKVAHKNLDVDQIHDIMEDVSEQQFLSREISDAISTPIGYGQDYDDDELEKELDDLVQEDLDNELLNINEVSHPLPDIPTDDIQELIITGKDKKTDVIDGDEDLQRLSSWAN